MTKSTTITPTPQTSTPEHDRAPRLNLSRECIHFANDPRQAYRSAPQLRLVGELVGRR